MHRRQFLTRTLAGSTALLALGHPRARAQSAPGRRIVSVQLAGAPPRWMFDFFPAAYSADGLQVDGNRSICTHYRDRGGRYVEPVYGVQTVKGIGAPLFWTFDVPRAGGGVRPAADLLDHLLSMQGISTGVDGHETNQRLHFQPVSGAPSLTALAADASDAPLPAVDIRTEQFRFTSARDKSPVSLFELEGNPLRTLLDPFLLPAEARSTPPGRVSGALAAARAQLDAAAVREAGVASRTLTAESAARTLSARSFGDLDQLWSRRQGVYADLVRRALSRQLVLPGIDDLPIGATGERGPMYRVEGEGGIETTPDLRDLFSEETTIEAMAEPFAIAEFLLLQDLSRAVSLSPSGLVNLAGGYSVQDFDEHGLGAMLSVVTNARFYLALTACLLELVDQLKAAGLFDDTVIELGAEFARSPLAGGEGSDHGWPAKIVSFLSGRIQGPHVVGNIYDTPPTDSGFRDEYPGTWGFAAPNEGGGVLTLSHMLSTTAAMLGVPSPRAATPSVVESSGGILRPTLPPARIVRAS